MSDIAWNESDFRSKVDAALQRARLVLENNKRPQLPANTSHTYLDKYVLAEVLSRTFVAASVQTLDAVGATAKHLEKMKEWAKSRSVTLRLKAEERCKFLRKVVREVRSDTTSVSKSTLFGTSEHYTVTKV
jgi:hypothetical protein